jgi:hypothetical protein
VPAPILSFDGGAIQRVQSGLADRLSDPAELFFEIGLGKDQRGGPAVRAVMRIGDQVPSVKERLDLKSRQGLASLDSCLAGNHVQKLGHQSVSGWRQGLTMKMVGKVPYQTLGDHARQHCWDTSYQHRIPAEWLDLQAKLRQELAVLDQGGGLGRRQVHRLGDQKPLRLDSPLRHTRA